MTTITQSTPWLSQVLEFNSAYSSRSHAAAAADARSPPAFGDALTTPRSSTNGTGDADKVTHDKLTNPALGNFDQIWQFLGVPSPPAADVTPNPPFNLNSIKDDYASDGAAYKSKGTTGVSGPQWSDGTDPEESGSVTSTGTPMSKTQRKKARRKARKSAAAAIQPQVGVVSESEAEHMVKQTPAKKASTHVRSATPIAKQRPGAASQASQQTVRQAALDTANCSLPVRTATHINDKKAQQPNGFILSDESARKAIEAVAKAAAAIKTEHQSPQMAQTPPRSPRTRAQKAAAVTAPTTPKVATAPKQKSQPQPGQHLNKTAGTFKLLPASLPPSTPQQLKNVAATPGKVTVVQSVLPGSAPPRRAKPPPTIEPNIIRSGEDRHWALLLKIIGDFYEDRKYLVSPMALTTHNNDPNGIHLFVDASNIFIGFMNQLKLSRGIHPMHQMPQANLSFDGLALLMERRRPVAKRVLVGSTPHLPAFDKAKAVGYETSILEKVYKARELTERQIYFRESDARRFGRPLRMTPGPKAVTANGLDSPSPGNVVVTSGSGNTPQFDPPKMIEQGVDEILHLKMLESVVDAERPSTMVVATGDAAAAEYSPGFMKMVQRALTKGWRVELISWSKSISSMYTKKAWTEQWGDRFRIIYLDDYAEELLDMDAAS